MAAERCHRVEHSLNGAERKEDTERLHRKAVGERKERRDRAGLQQRELPTVPGPLDVLGRALEFRHAGGQPGELRDDRVGQRLLGDGVLVECLGAPARARSNRDRLAAQDRVEDASVRGDDVVVRLDPPGHERFTQPQAGVDRHLRALTVQGIGREHDTGRFGADHGLHEDRHRDRCSGNLVSCAVADRAGGPEAAPAVHDRLEQRLAPDHVQVGVLLARERHLGKVFGGGRGANRDGWYPECGAGRVDRRGDPIGQLAESELATDGGRGGRQPVGIVRLQPVGRVANDRLEVVGVDEGVVGRGREDESVRNRKACADQARQIGSLSAHEGQVVARCEWHHQRPRDGHAYSLAATSRPEYTSGSP